MKTVVVSAFYKIPSKQPYDFYLNHLKRWFRSISGTIVFFTTPDVWQNILEMGFDVSHINAQFLPIAEWNAWTKGYDFWQRQKARDPEPYHTTELAAIWYQKKEFVKRAFQLISDVDIWIWCDAGCIRNDMSEMFARSFGNRNQLNLNDNRLHIQRINQIHKKQFYSYPDSRYAAAILAGNRVAWEKYDTIYEKVLCEYDINGVSGNSDQYILASCQDREPQTFVEHDPPHQMIDPWFFFLSIL